MTDWDERFMQLAFYVGQWSKDRSTKTGCVVVGPDRIVRTFSYNGFVRGVDDEAADKHERPAKYIWTEHAERNAVYNAARIGISLEGCTMYANWFPCVDCARAIIQSGIVELVAMTPDRSDPRWGQDFRASEAMFNEVGLKLRLLSLPHIHARGEP